MNKLLYTMLFSVSLFASTFNNRVSVFDNFHIIYERIKNDSAYIAIDYWEEYAVIAGNNNTNTDISSDRPISELEFRTGYNFFFNKKDHFVPIVGVGVFKDYNHQRYDIYDINLNYDELSDIVYGTFGFLYNHDFNKLFNLGFNVKSLVGGQIENNSWGSPVIGTDFSLPISFRFGYKRHWDLRIEPFNLTISGSDLTRNYTGFRGTIGYRF